MKHSLSQNNNLFTSLMGTIVGSTIMGKSNDGRKHCESIEIIAKMVTQTDTSSFKESRPVRVLQFIIHPTNLLTPCILNLVEKLLKPFKTV